MIKLYTDRLIIMTLNYEMINTIINDRDNFQEKFGFGISEDWPLQAISRILPNYMEMIKESPEEAKWGIWIIIDRVSNKLVGDLGYKGEPDEEGIIEVGYSIIKDFRNKGLITEGVNELIEWAFENGEVQKIVAGCLVDNYPSIKVLEKLGFQKVLNKDNMYYWEKNRE